jgi:hypothetical protein
VAVTCIVEVRYTGSDWADLMADMRSWLDRRQISTEEFNYSPIGRGIAIWIGFRSEKQAAAFAEAFEGRLQFADLHGAAAQGRMHLSPGDEADPFVSTLSPKRSAPIRRRKRLQPMSKAPQAGVSLMITRRQKADLRVLGYTDDQIRDMKPEEAHRVLGLIEEPPSASARRRRSPR